MFELLKAVFVVNGLVALVVERIFLRRALVKRCGLTPKLANKRIRSALYGGDIALFHVGFLLYIVPTLWSSVCGVLLATFFSEMLGVWIFYISHLVLVFVFVNYVFLLVLSKYYGYEGNIRKSIAQHGFGVIFLAAFLKQLIVGAVSVEPKWLSKFARALMLAVLVFSPALAGGLLINIQ